MLLKYFLSTFAVDGREIAARYDTIAEECSFVDDGLKIITCLDEPGECAESETLLAYHDDLLRKAYTCERAWGYSISSKDLGQITLVGILIHEFSHSTLLHNPGTEDYAYGTAEVLDLDEDEALNNADTFNWFAEDAFLRVPRV